MALYSKHCAHKHILPAVKFKKTQQLFPCWYHVKTNIDSCVNSPRREKDLQGPKISNVTIQ
jgi:hypothetical protein